jgi:RNA polymerase sigma-70 factor (ECF subfamily)
MMGAPAPGHERGVGLLAASSEPLSARSAERERPVDVEDDAPAEIPAFDAVYDAHFSFVWRSARRLGVPEASVDDAVQEIFVVVHRKLPTFEARAHVRTWLFGIVSRVARNHRRSLKRKPAQLGGALADPDVESLRDTGARGPHEHAAESEAVRALHAILDELDDEKREVFVLAELEQMSAPEIAEAVGANVNTVYSRLRAARQKFDEGVARHRARDESRVRGAVK